MLSLDVRSVAQTHALAKIIVGQFPKGLSIGLSGELGAGKTEFVKGLANALGVTQSVTSPTFVLEQVYRCGLSELHHWDLYRLGNCTNLPDLEEHLGFENCFVVVEWPEKIPLVDDLLDIKIVIDSPPLCDPESLSEERIFRIIRAPEALFKTLKTFSK